MNPHTLTIPRARGPWRVAMPRTKLLVRGNLPGAFGYDLAAQGFRDALARGATLDDVFAAALPASWMVNARATSPVFRRWLTAPMRDAWRALLEHPDAPDADVTALVARLCTTGQGVAAVSKVLALLRPSCVPLLDDAAIWFARDAVPLPRTADEPSAGAEHFAPMRAWFAGAVREQRDALDDVAKGYSHARLDAHQTLDRLMWFESWGWRLFAKLAPGEVRWVHLRDGGDEAIVPMRSAPPGDDPLACVDVATVEDPTWRREAREAMRARDDDDDA